MEMIWLALESIGLALGSIVAGALISVGIWMMATRLGHPGWCLPLACLLIPIPFVLRGSSFLDMTVTFAWTVAVGLWFGSRNDGRRHAA